jgi:hypothetical protein
MTFRMRPRISTTHLSRSSAKIGFALVYLCINALIAVGSTSETRVIIREDADRGHRQDLERKLRAISGFVDLSFDSEGFLQLGTRGSQNGSNGARGLLRRAVSGKNLIVLEDASSRPDVVFCKVVKGTWANNSSSGPPVYIVLIDFADFRKVMGDKQARAAFDVGWGLLHELDHVVEDSEDPNLATVPGDCEDHINKMRQEVGLPRRMDYFFSALPLRADPKLVTRFVRLRFEQPEAPNRVKRYWLIWDAAVVGGLPEENQTISFQHSSAGSR